MRVLYELNLDNWKLCSPNLVSIRNGLVGFVNTNPWLLSLSLSMDVLPQLCQCTEGLVTLISADISSNELARICLHHLCPILSHILFSNDTFLFLEASTSGYSSLIHILYRFEALNGQLVNLTKYVVYFS